MDKNKHWCGQEKFDNSFSESLLKTKEIRYGSHGSVIDVPIVFHVVGPQHVQDYVSNAVLASQINRLDEDFNGSNSDTSTIPNYFLSKASINNNGWNFFTHEVRRVNVPQPGLGQVVGTHNGVDIYENNDGGWSANLITNATNSQITTDSSFNTSSSPWTLRNTFSNVKING